MTQDKLKPCREAFETWISRSGDKDYKNYLEKDTTGKYCLLTTQAGWAAWQAALLFQPDTIKGGELVQKVYSNLYNIAYEQSHWESKERVEEDYKELVDVIEPLVQALSVSQPIKDEWPVIPDGWHVQWLGTDKSGECLCQIKWHGEILSFDDTRTTFISRTGKNHKEALMACIALITPPINKG